jgi:hypothetical protein
MNWLNIHTSTLRTPEFISAEPIERATWLCVLSYSAEQENGGVIEGAAGWSDRQWQQICGVTAAEVHAAKKLLPIVGNDVTVRFFPLDKQEEVAARRLSGRKGGLKSGEARSKQNRSTPSTSASTEGKEIEREGNSAPATSMSPEEELTTQPGTASQTTPTTHTATQPSSSSDKAENSTTSGSTTPRQGEQTSAQRDSTSRPPESDPTVSKAPCSLSQAMSHGRAMGYPRRETEIWFKWRESTEWERPNGATITQWRRDLEVWMLKEMRSNPGHFAAAQNRPTSTPDRSIIDPAEWARWATGFATPPALEGASDRLVERFQRETAAGPTRSGSDVLREPLAA